MAKGFDHEAAAKSDIVARPDITSENVTPPPAIEVGKAGIKAVELDPSEDERNGRLMATAFSSVAKTLRGEELNPDHVSAAAECGAYLSTVMRQFSLPKGLYVGFLALVMASPLFAMGFQIFKSKPEAPKHG